MCVHGAILFDKRKCYLIDKWKRKNLHKKRKKRNKFDYTIWEKSKFIFKDSQNMLVVLMKAFRRSICGISGTCLLFCSCCANRTVDSCLVFWRWTSLVFLARLQSLVLCSVVMAVLFGVCDVVRLAPRQADTLVHIVMSHHFLRIGDGFPENVGIQTGVSRILEKTANGQR